MSHLIEDGDPGMGDLARPAYLVLGSSGEYSDWSQWPVAVYYDEAQAHRHAELADAEVRRRVAAMPEEPREVPNEPNPFDAHFDGEEDARWVYGYDNINYTAVEVPFRGNAPKVPS